MTKIYLETYGCTLNQSDSELMAGLLAEAGYEIVYDLEDADIVILNCCIVKKPTQDKIIHRIKEIKDKKPLILAGCLPQAQPNSFRDLSKIGTHQLNAIVDVVGATLDGHVISALAEEDSERLNLPKIRKSKFIEIIPICKGCLGSCSYCITKKARGNLFSYPVDAIVQQTKSAVEDGVKQIWLTSQDCGAYGKDLGTNLPSLLNELVKIPGDFKIRVGMMNPNHVKEYLGDLIDVFMDKKIFSFMHLPVQSGNDRILKLMNRKYTIDEYKNIVKVIRKNLKNVSIATDIIVGFPSETKEEFEESLQLVKELRFDAINMSRFWKRPGTKAADMKQLPPRVIKERSTLMAKEFDKTLVDRNRDWLNWRGKVFITEKGTLYNSWIGKNYAYKQVVVLSEEPLLGKEVEVKIIDVGRHDIKGKLI